MNTEGQRRDEVFGALVKHMGKTASVEACSEMAGQVLLWCVGNNVNGTADWPAAVELFKLGVNAGFSVGRSADVPRPDQATCRAYARKLLEGLEVLLGTDPMPGPLPANSSLVTAHGDGLTFDAGGMHPVSKQHALELAVWLIALADPKLEHAPQMLAKVATR